MRIIASGLVYDAARASDRRANNAFTGVAALADGMALIAWYAGTSERTSIHWARLEV